MEQLFNAASSLMGSANISSILAILKISSGEVTIETLFQSLIDGLTKFVQGLFETVQ